LKSARQLAERVAHHHRRWDFIAEEVAPVGQHDCDAGIDRREWLAAHDGCVSHAHARHIGDCVQRTGLENPDPDPPVPDAWARRRRVRDHHLREDECQQHQLPLGKEVAIGRQPEPEPRIRRTGSRYPPNHLE